MAPIIMLIPIIAIYHTIKKYGFIVKSVDNKGSYVNLIISIALYVLLIFIISGLTSEESISIII